jgi:hypothetical protein
MPTDRFQIAVERAASSCPAYVWLTLSPSQRAAAIYRKLRELDADCVKGLEHAEAQSSDR